MTEQQRIAVAEAIGTLILVVGGPGTAVLATGGFTQGSVGVLGVALAFGLSLLCAAYAIGSISGCHINPAVTAGLWALGKTKSRDVPYYVVGQVVGGLVGAGIIYVIAHSQTGFDAKTTGFASNGYGIHSPGGFKLPAAILTEVVFTGLFVFVIA
ncbi:MAG TPA: aquaporin, partial [Acidimicrobiia bacterium]